MTEKGNKMWWFSKPKICTHCNENEANREFEEKATCADCKINILISREAIVSCPVDNSPMQKIHSQDVIIDKCPKCKGIWLNEGELEAIQELSRRNGAVEGIITGAQI